MQGENRAGRNALREKEGSEKRASGQAGCGVPSLLSFLFPECPPYLGVLSPPRCGEWATSLARALPTTTPLYGSPPYVWGEMHCWYGSRPVPRGKAMRCVWARVCIFSLSFARSSFHCGQSIAMNSCECSTTNAHSPSFVYPNGIIALRC